MEEAAPPSAPPQKLLLHPSFLHSLHSKTAEPNHSRCFSEDLVCKPHLFLAANQDTTKKTDGSEKVGHWPDVGEASYFAKGVVTHIRRASRQTTFVDIKLAPIAVVSPSAGILGGFGNLAVHSSREDWVTSEGGREEIPSLPFAAVHNAVNCEAAVDGRLGSGLAEDALYGDSNNCNPQDCIPEPTPLMTAVPGHRAEATSAHHSSLDPGTSRKFKPGSDQLEREGFGDSVDVKCPACCRLELLIPGAVLASLPQKLRIGSVVECLGKSLENLCATPAGASQNGTTLSNTAHTSTQASDKSEGVVSKECDLSAKASSGVNGSLPPVNAQLRPGIIKLTAGNAITQPTPTLAAADGGAQGSIFHSTNETANQVALEEPNQVRSKQFSNLPDTHSSQQVDASCRIGAIANPALQTGPGQPTTLTHSTPNLTPGLEVDWMLRVSSLTVFDPRGSASGNEHLDKSLAVKAELPSVCRGNQNRGNQNLGGSQTGVCKYWVNEGRCARGVNCGYEHPPHGEPLKKARAAYLEEKAKANHAEGNAGKAKRAQVFGDWVKETYGGLRVMDVAAGAHAELAFHLAEKGVFCTSVEPRERKLTKAQRRALTEKRVALSKDSTPPLLPEPLVGAQRRELFADNEYWSEIVRNETDLLVGLHPDQVTEAIVDVALRAGVPFAVVPCCVFPKLFPDRRIGDGRSVITYDAFLEYLLEKGKAHGKVVEKAALKFAGSNVVIFTRT